MLGVNVGVAAPVAWFPFSGWKDSIDGDLHANGARRGRVLHAQEGRHLALGAEGPMSAARGRRGSRALPGSGRSPGALDELVVESELLAGNPLGDPARRPL